MAGMSLHRPSEPYWSYWRCVLEAFAERLESLVHAVGWRGVVERPGEQVGHAAEAVDEHDGRAGAQRVTDRLQGARSALHRYHTQHRLLLLCVRNLVNVYESVLRGFTVHTRMLGVWKSLLNHKLYSTHSNNMLLHLFVNDSLLKYEPLLAIARHTSIVLYIQHALRWNTIDNGLSRFFKNANFSLGSFITLRV